jgi:hypothetical protein
MWKCTECFWEGPSPATRHVFKDGAECFADAWQGDEPECPVCRADAEYTQINYGAKTLEDLRKELEVSIEKIDKHMRTLGLDKQLAYSLCLEEKDAYINVLSYLDGDVERLVRGLND